MISPALLASTAIAFALAAVLQGRAFLRLRWLPTAHTFAVVALALLPAALSAALLAVEPGSLVHRLVLWVGIFGVCGFAVPWGWVLFVEGRGAGALGIGWHRWKTSLGISAFFAAGSLVPVLQADLSRYEPAHLLGAVLHLNVGGLFELFLYNGLLHLRLRDAFGSVPAIVGSAAIYSLWHIGTEMPLHPDPIGALGMLFVVGLLCHAVFATTYNLLVVWPLFFSAGVMNDFILHLDLPDAIGRDLAWPALGWLLALSIPTTFLWLARRRA